VQHRRVDSEHDDDGIFLTASDLSHAFGVIRNVACGDGRWPEVVEALRLTTTSLE
jgi:hypothetical protein